MKLPASNQDYLVKVSLYWFYFS